MLKIRRRSCERFEPSASLTSRGAPSSSTKVERLNGELQNTVIETIPAVSQFWKFNPREYLSEPLYARK
jgi:hypothetical protein